MRVDVAAVVLLMAVACSAETRRAAPMDLPATALPTVTSTPDPGATAASNQPTLLTSAAPSRDGVLLGAVELRAEDPSPGGQFVVLVNTSDAPVDVDCWTVRSVDTSVTATIAAERRLPSGGQLRLLPEANVFDSTDTVALYDARGQLVDRTPPLVDRAGDDQLWFRVPSGAWRFGRGFHLLAQASDGQLRVGPEGGSGSC